jgi:cytochrome oxidase Cu insertion factor (SCO1/SenC/PrrC family)
LGSSHHFKTLPYFDADHLEGIEQSEYIVPPFQLVDERGLAYGLDSLKGKVWVAAFYDTHSPHLAQITERLLNVNFKYRNEPDIQIIVFSTRPDLDSVPAAMHYVQPLRQYLANNNKWKMLTGDSSAVSQVMHRHFFIRELGNEALFRLVDSQGHIRGLYGNTEYHMLNLIEDIALLRKEIDQLDYNERHQKN